MARHLKYTIPPAVALTLLYRPLLTRLDVYKIVFLIIIALVSTTPWDSYLIRTRIWTYPSDAIIGPTLFDIPAEELFFFVVQTYTTSLLYLFLSKPTFHPVYLRVEEDAQAQHHVKAAAPRSKYLKFGGKLVLAYGIKAGIDMIEEGRKATYMGLIIVWAAPFLLLLWTLAYQFVLGLPLSNTLLPIALPTLYLWIVDTLALKRGTWVIESGTKLGIHLWDGLEIEEAFFFLATNSLIVFGLIAFDNAMAILYAFPSLFPEVPALPSPVLLVRALLTPTSKYDEERIRGLTEAVDRLRRKSRSFYLASGVFQGRLRIDLIVLYSFCRVADDLIDDASSVEVARSWIAHLTTFLTLSYPTDGDGKVDPSTVRAFITKNFPPSAQLALLHLPTAYLTPQPLFDLLAGFETDLLFPPAPSQSSDFTSTSNTTASPDSTFPIATEADLDLYGARVAGTVADLCLQLVFHHHGALVPAATATALVSAGARMGIALQCVNIARDIAVDARLHRVYMPTSWLAAVGLTPETLIAAAARPTPAATARGSVEVEALRMKLLDKAFSIYAEARAAIERLPPEARPPMRVAVESYMEIGRVLREGNEGGRVRVRMKELDKGGRATVPKLRRLRTAWMAAAMG
ncbi:hypothetical protein B0A49_10452 [Cryomyces minteri]|uniref:Bifunctional lycopene cyclase/phytoene synthase n=1 Tax=Cryomyces minteri TaxID=331657 RepID=A0A4U0WET2_9PEZI|nr:hypothetical protein B0A49_10452 [Cryomyces minteri]